MHFLKGGGFIATSIFAIAAAVSIFVFPVATPLMIGVGVETGAAGVVTGINGIAEMQEGFTGNNNVCDDWFGGNQTAYDWYSFGTSAVDTVGTIWIGGWMSYYQPRIQAYNNVQNYNYSNTIVNNGYLDANSVTYRSYTKLILTQKQIIKHGKMIKEVSEAVTFSHSGWALGYSSAAMWELTVRNDLWLIVHFLLKTI